MSEPIGRVFLDGEAVDAADAKVSVFDIGFQRGYGCFEAMRSYGGRIFRLDRHLARLHRSAALLRLSAPPAEELAGWCRNVATGGDCIVRVLLSGGLDASSPGVGSAAVVYAETIDPQPEALRVEVRVAPWHADGEWGELTGAKTLSYGYNVAAGLAARDAGFDDALLVGRNGSVLEGPTFSAAWVTGGTLRTPDLDLGILESITRQAVLEVAVTQGVPVETGSYPVADVLAADEVFAMSTVKEIRPIGAVGETTFSPGPVTSDLKAGFLALVAEEAAR